MSKREVVAKRQRILASYEVAGGTTKQVRASWRDAGFRPSRQDGFGFETNPGMWCPANFRCRLATAETRRKDTTHNNRRGPLS